MRTRRTTGAALACLALVMSAGAGFADDEAPSIDPIELKQRLDSAGAPAVIDVRTSAEFVLGHIPGAVNIPFDEVASRIGEVTAPHGVAVYCMRGPRARKGEANLLEAGYEAVLHIEGGLFAWQAAGLPIETGP